VSRQSLEMVCCFVGRRDDKNLENDSNNKMDFVFPSLMLSCKNVAQENMLTPGY
jgi:hypothetical protein